MCMFASMDGDGGRGRGWNLRGWNLIDAEDCPKDSEMEKLNKFLGK